jgi:surfactin synthase thioesterase subunit
MICFPHSGGSAGEYVRWADLLPDVEVLAAQWPGRGSRMSEPNLDRMEDLVAAFVDAVDLAPPFVLFGHSMGALVAYEVSRALRARRRPGPGLVVASSHRAPRRGRHARRLSELGDAELIASVEETYGTLPAEVMREPELLALMVPPLRADFAVLEHYADPGGEPLACPLLATGGDGDDVAPAELDEWRDATSGPFERATFPGGHFYLREQQGPLLARIDQAIRRHVA